MEKSSQPPWAVGIQPGPVIGEIKAGPALAECCSLNARRGGNLCSYSLRHIPHHVPNELE